MSFVETIDARTASEKYCPRNEDAADYTVDSCIVVSKFECTAHPRPRRAFTVAFSIPLEQKGVVKVVPGVAKSRMEFLDYVQPIKNFRLRGVEKAAIFSVEICDRARKCFAPYDIYDSLAEHNYPKDTARENEHGHLVPFPLFAFPSRAFDFSTTKANVRFNIVLRDDFEGSPFTESAVSVSCERCEHVSHAENRAFYPISHISREQGFDEIGIANVPKWWGVTYHKKPADASSLRLVLDSSFRLCVPLVSVTDSGVHIYAHDDKYPGPNLGSTKTTTIENSEAIEDLYCAAKNYFRFFTGAGMGAVKYYLTK